jgi:hypothetical protein
MAAHISTGAVWPDGQNCTSGRVLFICGEDDPRDTIQPRLKAMGANLDRIRILRGIEPDDGESKECFSFDISDASGLRDALTERRYRLLIIDPLAAFMPQVNGRNGKNLRRILAELAKIAHDTGTAILMITHLTKSGSGSAISRIMGKNDIPAACRSVWLVGEDPENGSQRLLMSVKQNLARRSSTLAFKVRKRRIIWKGANDITIENYSFKNTKTPRRGENRDEARRFLLRELEEGPVLARKIEAKAQEAGLSFSGAVRRASDELRIQKFHNKRGHWWSLPNKPLDSSSEQ